MSLYSVRKTIFLSLGSLLLLAGLVFVLIPVLPGILFIFLGVKILSKGSERIRQNKLILKYLEFFQKYMNYINRIIKEQSRAVLAGLVFVILILSSILGAIPAQAFHGIDASYRQVKTADSPVVYYLDHSRGQKKAYVNEVSFLAYGNKWSDVKIIHPELLRAWADVSLVKAHNEPEVFYIQNGKKTWVKNEKEFIENGYRWNEVVSISRLDLDQYEIVGESPYKYEPIQSVPVNNKLNLNTSADSGVLASRESVQASAPANNATGNINSASGENRNLQKGLTVESLIQNDAKQKALVNTNNNLVSAFKLSSSGETVKIEKIILSVEGVFDRSIVKNIYLTIGNDSSTKYEGYFSSNREVYFNFQHQPINVLSGRDREIRVYADFEGNESVNFQTARFFLKDKNSLQTGSEIHGNFPLKSAIFEFIYLENLLGQAQIEKISLNRSLEVKLGATGEELAIFTITETSGIEDLKISRLVFDNMGSATQEDLENLTLKDSRGRAVSQVKKINGRTIEFRLDDYQIKKDSSAKFSVHADIVGGENKIINLKLKEAVVAGSEYDYFINPTYLDISEQIKIIREKLNVISGDLKVNSSVFKQQTGTLIGVYEIRTNNEAIVLENIKITLSKSDFAPEFSGVVHLVNYDTGDVYNYARPVYDDFLVMNLPRVEVGAKKNIKLALIASISDKANQGDRYASTLNNVTYRVSGSGAYLEDALNVSGKIVTISKSNLFIYGNLDSENVSYIKGQKGVKVASFYLESAHGDDVLINGISFGKGDTSGVLTYENGFSNIKLKIGNRQLGGVITQPYGNVYDFGGFSYILRSGQRVEVSIYADTDKSTRVSNTQLMVSKITAQSNASGVSAVVEGLNAKSYTVNFGELKALVQAGSGGSLQAGEKNNFVGSFIVANNGDENIRLGDITLLTTGNGFSSSLGYANLRIRENESSRSLGVKRTPVSGANRVSLGRQILTPGQEKTFDVYVDAGQRDSSDGFELRFAELTAEGEKSKISVNVSGLPTSSVIVGKGNSFVDESDDDNENSSGRFSLAWPLNGTVSATFNDPNYLYQSAVGNHQGIDIVVAQGTSVKAATDGVVYSVIDGGTSNTSYIIISHAGGYRTLYAHMSRMDVAVGDTVELGDVIGLSGGTPSTPGAGSYTNGPHLHFEVHKNGTPVDPMDYLN